MAFDASVFAQPLGMLRNLGQMAPGVMGTNFAFDLGGPMAVQGGFNRMPMVLMGGGSVFDPASAMGGVQALNPVGMQARTQQAGDWFQNQGNLTDFLSGVAGDRDQLMAMLTQLRAMQQQKANQQQAGLMGSLGL